MSYTAPTCTLVQLTALSTALHYTLMRPTATCCTVLQPFTFYSTLRHATGILLPPTAPIVLYCTLPLPTTLYCNFLYFPLPCFSLLCALQQPNVPYCSVLHPTVSNGTLRCPTPTYCTLLNCTELYRSLLPSQSASNSSLHCSILHSNAHY